MIGNMRGLMKCTPKKQHTEELAITIDHILAEMSPIIVNFGDYCLNVDQITPDLLQFRYSGEDEAMKPFTWEQRSLNISEIQGLLRALVTNIADIKRDINRIDRGVDNRFSKLEQSIYKPVPKACCPGPGAGGAK
jgi:hypothetical protein